MKNILELILATSHLHIVAIFKKKRHKQDGMMKLRGESGYLPKTPDHQTKYVTPQFSQFFIPSYPLVGGVGGAFVTKIAKCDHLQQKSYKLLKNQIWRLQLVQFTKA